MKKILSVAIVTLFVLIGTVGVSLAQKQNSAAQTSEKKGGEEKFLAKGDGVESCPVSGEKLESKNIKAEFFGRTVYFCCDDCLATAKKNPELYVKKTEAEQKEAIKKNAAMGKEHAGHEGAATAFIGKGDGETTCPVTGEPIDKSVKTEIMGKTVYACCPGCLASIKKSPELYLKWVADMKK